MLYGPTDTIVVGDNRAYVHIPPGLNGMELMYVHAEVITAPTSATILIQLAKDGSTDMLNARIMIDATETGSDSATTPATFNTDGSEDVVTNNTIEIDIDQVGSSEPGKGLVVTMGFRIP